MSELIPARERAIRSIEAARNEEVAGSRDAAELGAAVGTRPGRGRRSVGAHAHIARALLRACRPRQWVKNVLVAAAPAAAGILTHPEVPGEVAGAFVCFCMLSSATYLLNDVHDRDEDRAHPRTRTRPVATGELPVRVAVIAAIALALCGLALAFAVRPALAGVGAAYLALTACYSLWWRRVAVADIAAVAGGFVLRALAGGAATSVGISRWFLIVTSFGALFLVAGKRYAELREARSGQSTRASLRAYSEPYLRGVLTLTAAVTTMSYCLWAFQRAPHAGLSWYELTIVPFVLWLLRYGLLLDQGAGQAPEELVLHDGFLLAMSAAWLVVFMCGVYVGG
ncbi:MAG TPA: decaprenyl-phosphate phosphoribosyltransferase [Solirubrobacteraceae bacterium]|nr:decaprenyl-phosphate phosphoribosyltransferase [Solirubrobacteraceae bacterium]